MRKHRLFLTPERAERVHQRDLDRERTLRIEQGRRTKRANPRHIEKRMV